VIHPLEIDPWRSALGGIPAEILGARLPPFTGDTGIVLQVLRVSSCRQTAESVIRRIVGSSETVIVIAARGAVAPSRLTSAVNAAPNERAVLNERSSSGTFRDDKAIGNERSRYREITYFFRCVSVQSVTCPASEATSVDTLCSDFCRPSSRVWRSRASNPAKMLQHHAAFLRD